MEIFIAIVKFIATVVEMNVATMKMAKAATTVIAVKNAVNANVRGLVMTELQKVAEMCENLGAAKERQKISIWLMARANKLKSLELAEAAVALLEDEI